MTSILPNINNQCWNSNDFHERPHFNREMPSTTISFNEPRMISSDLFSISEVSTEQENDDFIFSDELDLVWSEIMEPTPFREGTSLESSSWLDKQYMGVNTVFRPLVKMSSRGGHYQNKPLLARSVSDESLSITQKHKRAIPELSTSTMMQQSKRARIRIEKGGQEKDTTPQFREYQDAQWQEQYQALLDFKSKHGNCNVPHTYELNPALSRWVKRQRYQYRLKTEGKRTSMSQERQDKLQDVGFVWDPHAALWETRRTELEEYKQQVGSCDVPCRYSKNPQLGMWVRSQRREYKLLRDGKMSRMTPERYEILDKMGFVWDPRGAAMTSKAKA